MDKVILESLTNEKIRHKFRNNFDLANYAIEVAKAYIKQGTPHSLKELIFELTQLTDIEETKI